jgi:hypothetical protein
MASICLAISVSFLVGACVPIGADIDRRVTDLERRVTDFERVRPRLGDIDWDRIATDIPTTVTDPATQDRNGNDIHDAYDDAGFIPRGPYPVGRNPRYLAYGRINTPDERIGLAVSNLDAGSVTLLRQGRDGSFELEETLSGVGDTPTCIAIGDLDADGYQDFVVGHGVGTPHVTVIRLRDLPYGVSPIYTLRNYAVSTDPGFAREPKCVVIGDFDGGGLDVLATSGESTPRGPNNRMFTLFSNGMFDSPINNINATLTVPGNVVGADFDGDGDLDACAVSESGGPDQHVSCLVQGRIGTVSGEFGSWVEWKSRTTIVGRRLAAGDLNGDDQIDLVVVGAEGVAVLLNSRSPWMNNSSECREASSGELNTALVGCYSLRFSLPDLYRRGEPGTAVAIVDVDSDGDRDLAVTVESSNEVVLLKNDGHGNFGGLPAVHLPVGMGPTGIVASDLDGDGRVELAIAHSTGNDVWVLHHLPAR